MSMNYWNQAFHFNKRTVLHYWRIFV